MNHSPLISVIIPVWNGAQFLRDAIASIMAQNHTPLEIIVIDDGSTDETAVVATEFRDKLTYHALPHRGLVAARRAGLEAAHGELIACLDVDDQWSQDKTQLQLRLLQEHPEAMMVLGHTQLLRLVGAPGKGMGFKTWGNPILALSFGSALIHRAVFDLVGDFRDPRDNTVDVDWFMRARELAVSIHVHPEVVQFYRRHRTNMTNDTRQSAQSILNALKDSLSRRKVLGMEHASLSPLQGEPKQG